MKRAFCLSEARRKLVHGESLFRAGDRFDTVFAVWSGSFKTVATMRQGHEQIMGFQMTGELIGLDAIDSGHHQVDAIALEDSQVCLVPYGELATLSRELPSLQSQFNRLVSREIVQRPRRQATSLSAACMPRSGLQPSSST